jgi:acyl carrier protein
MDYRAALLEFVRDHLAPEPGMVTAYDQPLLSSGVIDSFAVAEILGFLEEEFGVAVSDDNVRLENLDTVEAIVINLVEPAVGS